MGPSGGREGNVGRTRGGRSTVADRKPPWDLLREPCPPGGPQGPAEGDGRNGRGCEAATGTENLWGDRASHSTVLCQLRKPLRAPMPAVCHLHCDFQCGKAPHPSSSQDNLKVPFPSKGPCAHLPSLALWSLWAGTCLCSLTLLLLLRSSQREQVASQGSTRAGVGRVVTSLVVGTGTCL